MSLSILVFEIRYALWDNRSNWDNRSITELLEEIHGVQAIHGCSTFSLPRALATNSTPLVNGACVRIFIRVHTFRSLIGFFYWKKIELDFNRYEMKIIIYVLPLAEKVASGTS